MGDKEDKHQEPRGAGAPALCQDVKKRDRDDELWPQSPRAHARRTRPET